MNVMRLLTAFCTRIGQTLISLSGHGVTSSARSLPQGAVESSTGTNVLLMLFNVLVTSWVILCMSTALTAIGCITLQLAAPRDPRTFLSPSIYRREAEIEAGHTTRWSRRDFSRLGSTRRLSTLICVQGGAGMARRQHARFGCQSSKDRAQG